MLLLSFLIFFLLFSLPVSAETLEVVVSCRMTLLPWVLDSIRIELSDKLKKPVRLVARPTGSGTSIKEISSGTLLLAEQGMLSGDDMEKLNSSGVGIGLVWCLGIRVDEVGRIASGPPETFPELLNQAEQIRKSKMDGYPWFESLYSPQTLLRLEKVLDKSGKTASEAALNPKSVDLSRLIHDALDKKLMNPLSLESDESMAFDVLEAGDCVFGSLWVPEEVFCSPEKNLPKLKGIKLVSFPGSVSQVSSPRITLKLFFLKSADQLSMPKAEDFPKEMGFEGKFFDCDFNSEKKWIQEKYPILYNALINRTQ